MHVHELMSSPVVSLLAEQTVPLACDIMRFKHVRHLPVVDHHHRLVGLVSHRDLLRWADVSADLRRDGRELRVDEIMIEDVWTVHANDDAASVGSVMLARKLGCAPVIDDDGRLVGIVTESDFLRVAIDTIEGHGSTPRLAILSGGLP